MNCDEIVSGLILEFRRGTLIMVVLAQLNKPMYGYSLVKELEGKGISIEGNTLYPLLRRLESQGLLKSEWETEATKPRKYYIITEDGKLVSKKIKDEKIYIYNYRNRFIITVLLLRLSGTEIPKRICS